ncbi:MAG: CDP-2,3-bis-(O-geranylgeranyl)-sn-glycerol synthase [Methanobacteriota archaeon]|jgi:CDP-2,3-bis-(O-geranylgeranyl)-sn-glycerol synthase
MIESILSAIYFFLPAYVANICACLLGYGRPFDFGKNFLDGRRILGDGVTIRGSAAGIASGSILGFFMAYFNNPLLPYATFNEKLFLAFLLSSGAILGGAAGSFIKRRLGMARGVHAPVLDQLNFVVGALFFASFAAEIPLQTVIILFILTPIGHLAVNKTGYLLKLKNVPW